VSHETNEVNHDLGDGGGGTVMPIAKTKSDWKVSGDKRNIDFTPVGGTLRNCSGFYTAKGTVLTAEEFPPSNNLDLYRDVNYGVTFRDTSDINHMKRWQHMGWIVEVDPVSGKALRKLYGMGRCSHEGLVVMPDQKTVYITDDYSPAVFFKFVANNENNFEEGQLYAYQQSQDGSTGNWIALPMDMNSLINCREIALKMGATMFVRMEWITQIGGKVYITETGHDAVNWSREIAKGASVPRHLETYKMGEGLYSYPYGGVLELDPVSNKISMLVAGGQGKNKNQHFSNPDGIASCTQNGKNYLYINEDIIGLDKGRVPEGCMDYINEVYVLDLSISSPTVDDLQWLLTAPYGSETTGGYFTPDAKSYFLNIQHPSRNNQPPFNKSTTIVITGF
jgi:uncharacterized protein